ncbi:hypothetical protein [Halomonas casei]|uniref:hypothetical protein n=1 Tax=Halomonas casei TaxID=2742613 RepID=UPI003CFA625A
MRQSLLRLVKMAGHNTHACSAPNTTYCPSPLGVILINRCMKLVAIASKVST